MTEPLSYSRLDTYLKCGWQGRQQYELGFESGLLQSAAEKGRLVHKAIELLHLTYPVFDMDMEELLGVGGEILDSIWTPLLGGREELAYLRKFIAFYDRACEDAKKDFLRREGRPTRAPQMTSYFKRKYGDQIGRMHERIEWIARLANMDQEDEPIFQTFADSFKFVENYIRLLIRELEIPEHLYCELDMQAFRPSMPEFTIDHPRYPWLSRTYQFRGVIDLIWILKDGSVMILDIKTSRKAWTPNSIRHHDQLFLYDYFWFLKTGKYASKVGIVDVRTDRGKLITAKPSSQDRERFLTRYGLKVEQYNVNQDHNLATPAAGNPYSLCSNCSIGRHGICPFYTHHNK